MLPPFGKPPGHRVPDADVLMAYAHDDVAGYSARLHVEGAVLYIDALFVAALRLTPGTVLVRRDVPDDVRAMVPRIEAALEVAGMAPLDENTLLGVPVALQMVGIRLSDWDLWGADIDVAFAALRAIATGDLPPAAGQAPVD